MSDRTYILVVDDNDLRRSWTKHALVDLSCTVVAVPSVHQALQCLRRIRFDAVIMAEHLRGMNVRKFYSVFHERYPEIPMIVTSFAWPVGRHVTSMSPGAYHCLLLCAQDWDAALGTAVKRALEASHRGEQDGLIKVGEEHAEENCPVAV
jgi:DNA-binding NtrC family response regulator